jgi:hypothetical protein
MATGWRRAIVSMALSPGALAVARRQRLDRLGDLSLGEPAHLRRSAGEILQIRVEGFRRVFRPSHGMGPIHAAPRCAIRFSCL